MASRNRLQWHQIEIDRHPMWSTHFIQQIDIVDTRSGLIGESIETFSAHSGLEAANDARRQALAWIADQGTEEK